MRAFGPVTAALGLAAAVAIARDARAFCRAQTCPLPPDFYPSPTACVPEDFAQYCASLALPVKPVPLWWRNAVVSYDIQRRASAQIAYDQAAQTLATAFSTWTSATCPAGSGASGRVSIDVRDLGPVDCDQVQYNEDQGNQHLIVFRDDFWPHNDPYNTLALTTITFDHETGEIFDADTEINATVPLSVGDPVPPGGYDLLSIVTHEAGHFLGMAHSGDQNATMFFYYAPGSTAKRALTADDVAGICAIDPPDGTRSVDPSVAATGKVPEDPPDPTPRHGFQSQCAQYSGEGCAVAPGRPRGPWRHGGVLATVVIAAAAGRRRRSAQARDGA